jgi:DNA-binding PadR family transcriptional regulator
LGFGFWVYLGEFEFMVLLAVLRLGDDAYGVTIRNAITHYTSRDVTLGAIYKTLGRLEDKQLLSARLGEPTPERGGRRKKLYRVEAAGRRAVRQSVTDLRRLADGLRGALGVL